MRWLAVVLVVVGVAACATPEAGSGTAGPDRTVDAGDGRGGRDAGARPGTDTGVPGPDAEADAPTDSAGGDSGADPDVDAAGPGDTGESTDAADTAAPDALDAGTPDAAGPRGAVRGTVWAPGNAPGMAPAGQMIPVSGALVYLSATRPDPIPQHAYCEACVAEPPRAVFSDARGSFVLADRPVGTWWLVIQKGQFRREVQVTIEDGADIVLDPADTVLPSRHDPDNGMWIPRIALATGSYDHMEDIFGKLGMGSVDSSGAFADGSLGGEIDVWSNGGRELGAPVRGTLAELVRDVDQLLQYHIVFIPCSGDSNTSVLRDTAALENLRRYVSEGGNLYVTDWSGEWHDNVFPAFVTLAGAGVDTPSGAFDLIREVWTTARFGNADGSAYDSPDGEAVDPDLHAWLDGQRGPTAESDTVVAFDASRFYVEGSWNTIDAVNRVQVGTDRAGDPIYNEPHVWVIGSADTGIFGGGGGKKPLTVTYEPVGCGRVLYSTYHTTDDTHPGLAPQERVLVYLIMQIGTCRDPKR